MKTLDEIKQMMAVGDIAGAEAAILKLLKKAPDNLQAKMLYGACLQLQGDKEAFGRIHEELAPKMAAVSDEKTLGMWRKYHALWMTLIVGGLVLAGAVGATYIIFGDLIKKSFAAMTCGTLYGGPEYFELKQIESMPEGPEKWRRRKEFETRERERSVTITGVGHINEN